MKKPNQSVIARITLTGQSAVVAVLLLALAVAGCSPQDVKSPPLPEAQLKSPSHPAIEFTSTQIDLGKISPQQQQIVGELHFQNVGGQPLKIGKVTSPSPCLAGFSGSRFVRARRTGALRIKFDPAGMPSGDVKCLVNIETNDPKHPTTPVHFSFNIERDAAQEQIRLLKNDLSAMRKDVLTLRREVDKLTAAAGAAKPQPDAKPARSTDNTVYDVTIGSSPVLGPNDATVTIVEFVDFQCPYCIREWATIKQITRQYHDKVKLVFKHFPLRFHTKAPPAHAAAELARLHGGADLFWKMHDMIIAQPRKLDVPSLRVYAKMLNMDLTRFDEVMADPNKINELLAADLAEARKCSVRGTPTILINGSKLTNRSLNAYKTRIDRILAEQKG
jgi:protein-disulfide isomerase